MKFVFITGPQAVGKMAVGMELAKQTGLKLFHNHMSIELVLQLFPYETTEAQYLIRTIRREIFETMANSDQVGLIFTFVWAFDLEKDNEYVKNLLEFFEAHGAATYIVELEADLDTRLARNQTELRLQEKPSKRNIEWSNNELIKSLDKYRLNSLPGEITHPNYLKINNTNLSILETVQQIRDHFQF